MISRFRQLGLLLGVALIASTTLSLFAIVQPAAAAGERYRWINGTTIEATGGNIQGTVRFTSTEGAPSGGNFPIYRASTINDNSGCIIGGLITIINRNPANASLLFNNTLSGSTGSVSACSDARTNSYDRTATISDTQNAGQNPTTEPNSTKIINVTAQPVSDITTDEQAQQAAPKEDTITLKDSTGRTLQTKRAGYKVAGYLYYTEQFTGVNPGQYSVCSEVAQNCVSITKVANAVLNITIPGKNQTIAAPGANEKVCTTGDGLAGALAWVLCPAAELMAGATNFIETNIIEPFLTVSPLTTAPDDPVYKLWQAIRNLANVAFIIVFFIIIFSQATSLGISNYGIKRMLPRIVLLIIVVNLSYFLTAFTVDFFNILQGGIASLISAVLGQATGDGSQNGGTSAGVGNILVFGGAALLAIIVAAGPILGWFIGLLGTVFLLIVALVIALIGRQIGIIAFAFMSPLVVLGYLLPNTQGMSKKAVSMFFDLLKLGIAIILALGVGDIVAAVFQNPNFQLGGDGMSGEVGQAFRVLLVYLIQGASIVLIPVFVKATSAGASRAINAIQSRGAQGAKNAKKGYEESSFGKYRKERKDRRVAQELLGNKQPGGFASPAILRARARRRFYGSTLSRGYGAAMSEQLLSAGKENQEKMRDQFSSLSPFAAQAFIESGGDQKKLHNEIERRVAQGQLNEYDVSALRRLERQGMLGSGSAMAGAAVALASNGFLEQKHVRAAEQAIKQQYGTGSPASELALDRMADAMDSGAKNIGMAQHARWGVVGGKLIQNGQDFDIDTARQQLTRVAQTDSSGKTVRDAAGNVQYKYTNEQLSGMSIGDIAQAYEQDVQTKLGFVKMPAAKLSRKSFESNDGGYGLRAFRETLQDENYQRDVLLSAEGTRGQMNPDDRKRLRQVAELELTARGKQLVTNRDGALRTIDAALQTEGLSADQVTALRQRRQATTDQFDRDLAASRADINSQWEQLVEEAKRKAGFNAASQAGSGDAAGTS